MDVEALDASLRERGDDVPVVLIRRRFVEKAGTDGLELADGLAERNEIDDITLERHHRAEGLLVHGADGPQPEAGGQHAVVRLAAWVGRQAHPGLKLGICGEHGGDPESIEFFHMAGLDYVSCSPYRVPIARVAAALAAIQHAD